MVWKSAVLLSSKHMWVIPVRDPVKNQSNQWDCVCLGWNIMKTLLSPVLLLGPLSISFPESFLSVFVSFAMNCVFVLCVLYVHFLSFDVSFVTLILCVLFLDIFC